MSAQLVRKSAVGSGVAREENDVVRSPAIALGSGNGQCVVRRLRLKRRRSAAGNVVLETSGRLRTAALIDVSESGIGILASDPLDVGSHVGVHFVDGRKACGVVMWRRGERYGVGFDSPLETAPSTAAPFAAMPANPAAAAPSMPVGQAFAQLAASLLALAAPRGGSSRRRAAQQRAFERAWRENGGAWLVSDEAQEMHAAISASNDAQKL